MMPARNQPVLLVRRPGLFTTVQDLGRYGYQRYGVPVSGAMDRTALRIGNRLVGNADEAAGLEITLQGPELQFVEPIVMAVTGADLSASLNNRELPLWTAIAAAAGEVLRFGHRRQGARAYLCLQGGIDVPLMFGSRATDVRNAIGGLDGRRLAKEDRLYVCPREKGLVDRPLRPIPTTPHPLYRPSPTLRVILSSEASFFSPDVMKDFFADSYAVSAESDRTGYRLRGAPMAHRVPTELLSAATAMGTIQVPKDQQPIVLMADCQPTGGYPKLASVITADLPQLGQLAPGDTMKFALITLEEAVHLYRKEHEELDRLLPPSAASRRPCEIRHP